MLRSLGTLIGDPVTDEKSAATTVARNGSEVDIPLCMLICCLSFFIYISYNPSLAEVPCEGRYESQPGPVPKVVQQGAIEQFYIHSH